MQYFTFFKLSIWKPVRILHYSTFQFALAKSKCSWVTCAIVCHYSEREPCMYTHNVHTHTHIWSSSLNFLKTFRWIKKMKLLVFIIPYYECLWGPCQLKDWCLRARHSWGGWSCTVVSGTAPPHPSWLLPPLTEWIRSLCCAPICWVLWRVVSRWVLWPDGAPARLGRALQAMRGCTVCRECENSKMDWISVCILLPCAHNSKPGQW